jgi:tetratricopeptide (TPR) repeat protein
MARKQEKLKRLKQQLLAAKTAFNVEQTMVISQTLITLQPSILRWKFELASALFESGSVSEALPLLQMCSKSGLKDPDLDLLQGHCLSAIGHYPEAIHFYKKTLRQNNPAQNAAGFWSLADLRNYAFTTSEKEQLLRLCSNLPTQAQYGFLVHFSLARLFDDEKKFEQAFQSLKIANQQVAQHRGYDAAGYKQLLDSLKQITVATPCTLEAITPVPIFIVGMPRSGSTLIEQILAGHPQICSTNELPFIENIARSLDQQGGLAGTIAGLGSDEQSTLRDTYYAQVAPHLETGKAFFTDKWPDNFWFVALIFALIAEAKIINIIRDPLDNAMGQFRQYFAKGNAFSFSLPGILDYWSNYLQIMNHWDQVFPGKILHVSYEQLATSPQQEMKRVYAYCGLGFAAESLDITQGQRNIMTPSGSQLRSGINAHSIGSGEHYHNSIQRYRPELERLTLQAKRLIKP